MSTKNTKNKDVLSLNFKPLKKKIKQYGNIDWTIKLNFDYYDCKNALNDLYDRLDEAILTDGGFTYQTEVEHINYLPFNDDCFQKLIYNFLNVFVSFVQDNYEPGVTKIFRYNQDKIVVKDIVNFSYSTEIDNNSIYIYGPYIEFEEQPPINITYYYPTYARNENDELFERGFEEDSWVVDSTDLAAFIRYILRSELHLIKDESDFIDNSKFDTAAELIATLRKDFINANSDCNYKIEFIDN